MGNIATSENGIRGILLVCRIKEGIFYGTCADYNFQISCIHAWIMVSIILNRFSALRECGTFAGMMIMCPVAR